MLVSWTIMDNTKCTFFPPIQPELGVNEHHQAQVVNYMRFARYQRAQRLRAVDMCFEEMKQSR